MKNKHAQIHENKQTRICITNSKTPIIVVTIFKENILLIKQKMKNLYKRIIRDEELCKLKM